MSVVRFVIDGVLVNEKREWEIRIHPESLELEPIYKRRIQRGTVGLMAFPQPPESEGQAIPKAALHKHLCTTSEIGDILSVYLNIIRRDPAQRDMETFGRYLSQTLLGSGAWDTIKASAQGQPIELSICSHSEMCELARLPWEMMYGSNNFLVAQTQPAVAITRLISMREQSQSAAQPPVQPVQQIKLPSPLKVLFVVGAKLSDARILPGAEYLSLLRRLEAQGILNFQSRILLAATFNDLKDAVKNWQPSVVHFICHGGSNEQGGFIELAPDDKHDEPPHMYAPELQPLLTPDELKPLVVLNACYTGLATTLDYVPLAVELIQKGLPMVVGMVGSVADQACRLFTRNFYVTLLTGGSVVEATASGRQASFLASSGHQSGVDWIFPTLFMAEGVSPNITVDPCPQGGWAKLQQIAATHFNVKDLLFCDRIVCIEAYERLINSSDDATGLKMLAVEARPGEKSSQNGRLQFGKTRLLKELAARAVRDGHIPCVLDPLEVPSTPLDLGWQLIDAINTVYTRFEFPRPLNQDQNLAYEFSLLQEAELDAAKTARLSPLTRQKLQIHKNHFDHPAVIAAALCVDMRELANTARQQYPGAKLLLLIDDVHRFGVDLNHQGALDLLLDYFLTPGELGLLRLGDPMRVIFTYSRASEPGYGSAVGRLKDFVLGTPSIPMPRPISLEAFRSPEDAKSDACVHDDYHLAYQQFLLHKNYVIRHTLPPDDKENVYTELHAWIEGIPSRLPFPDVNLETTIRIFRIAHFLDPADDEQALDLQKKLAQQA